MGVVNNGGFVSAANGTNKVPVKTATATTTIQNPTADSVATWVIITSDGSDGTPNPYYTVGQLISYLSTHANYHTINVTQQNGPNKYTGTGLYPL